MKDLKEALFENTLWEFKKLMHAKELYGEDHDMTDIPRARFNMCWGIVEAAGLEKEYQAWKDVQQTKGGAA